MLMLDGCLEGMLTALFLALHWAAVSLLGPLVLTLKGRGLLFLDEARLWFVVVGCTYVCHTATLLYQCIACIQGSVMKLVAGHSVCREVMNSPSMQSPTNVDFP